MDYFSNLWTNYQNQILLWLGLGLVVGIIAKYLMPGKDKGGLITTALLGIGGSFLGGTIGSYLGLPAVNFFGGFNVVTLLTAIAGALILLLSIKIIKFIV